ncbi:MAG: monooxygenase [Rhodospirillaceae bacterium]|nr:monooxygenase [Rhodospirillaceae bacterium]|tara:strand:+ start:10077 stop:11303 length:1227 start_codon:yes stop_codon:yes gene_type:complete
MTIQPSMETRQVFTDATPEALIARASELVSELRIRQQETEEAGKVLPEAVESLKNAGLFRVVQPKKFGGLEFSIDDFIRTAIKVASGCGSTGWVYSTGAQHQWQIGLFAPDAQEEVWGDDPLALAASSYAPTGVAQAEGDGYRLTGKWSFCSGVEICQWMLLGVRIASSGDAEPTQVGFALIPKSDYEIKKNWDVLGLIGTGSHDLVIEDAFLPAHRILTHEQAQSGEPPGAEINTSGLYRIPFFAAISYCLCAAILGMARGALEDYLEGMRDRVIRGDALGVSKSVADFQSIQLRIAEASTSINAAEALVLQDTKEIMDIVNSGQELTHAQRIRNKGNISFAVKLSVNAVNLLFESVGGQGLHSENRLQRAWRDIHAASKHISMNWDSVATVYGRSQLGLPPGPAQY